MNKFTGGLLLERITLADGAEVFLGEGAMIHGCAERISVVMQPSLGDMAPWIHIVWSEEGLPDEYINMATVQRLVPKQEVSDVSEV